MDIKKMFEQWAAKMNIPVGKNAIIDTQSGDYGGLIPREIVHEMIHLQRARNQWLNAIDTREVNSPVGNFPITEMEEWVMEHIGENETGEVTSEMPTRHVEYSCVKFTAQHVITTEQLEDAATRAQELGDFEAEVTAQFAMAIGNNVAQLVINGDKSLDNTTRKNRLLNAQDGVLKALKAGGQVLNAEGKAFGPGVFHYIVDQFDEYYANDPGLQFLYHPRIQHLWMHSLTNVDTTERMRSAVGDAALTQRGDKLPLGIPFNLVPQISPRQGVTPTAPTSVADDGDGTMTIRVATVLPDATDSTGRKVKVVYKPTGKSEVCTVKYNGSSQNVIETVTSLGQSTISTDVADYTVTQYDETDVIYGNSKLVKLIWCNQWRSYRDFNPKADRWEFFTYMRGAVMIPVPELLLILTRLRVSPIESW